MNPTVVRIFIERRKATDTFNLEYRRRLPPSQLRRRKYLCRCIQRSFLQRLQ
jgi:hypothetical protein